MTPSDDLRAAFIAAATKVDAVQEDLRDFIDRLQRVTPPVPDDVMEAAVRLHAGLNSIADDLDTTPEH